MPEQYKRMECINAMCHYCAAKVPYLVNSFYKAEPELFGAVWGCLGPVWAVWGCLGLFGQFSVREFLSKC